MVDERREHCARIGLEQQHVAADHSIERLIKAQPRGVTLSKRYVAETPILRSRGRSGDGRRDPVDANDSSQRTDKLARKESYVTGSTSDIQDTHTLRYPRLAKKCLRDGLEQTRLGFEAGEFSI